jgi:hypothetical protein
MLTVMNPEVAVNTDCLVDECLWPDTSDQIALVKGQLLGTPGEVPHTSRYASLALTKRCTLQDFSILIAWNC